MKKNIIGYRELSEQEISAINDIKELAIVVQDMIASIKNKPDIEIDPRWLSIGTTNLQQGFMALIRSVAKPTTF
jgi:hypothetical protein